MVSQRRADSRSGDQLNLIVFSKDRAAQLDLLLRSIRKWFDRRDHVRLSILFTASNDAYSQGYDVLRQLHPEFTFRDERTSTETFQMCTLALVDPSVPYTMFLVDDDVFKNPFSLEDEEFRRFTKKPNQLCLSLRLGKHITYCYPMDVPSTPPRFDPGWSWKWRGLVGDWGYPMSLDGHIFRTADLLPLLKSRRYENPNRLEEGLAATPLRHRTMSCYEYSRILNLPVNRVQQVINNRYGEVTASDLNQAFLDGRRIQLEPFDRFINESCHQELPLELK